MRRFVNRWRLCPRLSAIDGRRTTPSILTVFKARRRLGGVITAFPVIPL
jgi:hypothetical protein